MVLRSQIVLLLSTRALVSSCLCGRKATPYVARSCVLDAAQASASFDRSQAPRAENRDALCRWRQPGHSLRRTSRIEISLPIDHCGWLGIRRRRLVRRARISSRTTEAGPRPRVWEWLRPSLPACSIICPRPQNARFHSEVVQGIIARRIAKTSVRATRDVLRKSGRTFQPPAACRVLPACSERCDRRCAANRARCRSDAWNWYRHLQPCSIGKDRRARGSVTIEVLAVRGRRPVRVEDRGVFRRQAQRIGLRIPPPPAPIPPENIVILLDCADTMGGEVLTWEAQRLVLRGRAVA